MSTRAGICLSVVTSLACFDSWALAQEAVKPITTPRYAKAIRKAREIVEERMQAGIPGLSVAVAIEGKLVWAEGFGFSDLEQRVPMSRLSCLRIGSVSKPLTAAAIGLLVEAGKLDLDAPVQKYVPDFPEKKHPITSRQLAGHLAGIRHYRGLEMYSNKYYSDVTSGLGIFKDDPLLFEPETRYSYSSYGWNLLSAVIETAAEQEFLDHMQEKVFEPLGMDSTFADRNLDIVPHRVRFYQKRNNGGFTNAPYVDNSYKWAGGGFVATMEDLCRFGSAHLKPGFLKQETLDLLMSSQHTKDGEPTGYGIGWQVRKDGRGRTIYQHGGGSIGGTTMLVLVPDEKLVIATSMNLSRGPYPGFREIAEAFM